MKKSVLNVSAVALCFSISAHAAINEIGSLNWDTSSSYITVDGSSTRYMNLGYTEGKTYEQTLAALASDPLLNGFRIANTVDAYNFYNAMATVDATNTSATNQTFYEGVSFTDNQLGAANTGQFNHFYFLEGQYEAGKIQFRDDSPSRTYKEILLSERPDTSITFGLVYDWMDDETTSRGPVNILLVSDSAVLTTAVPEPETYAMFMAGLGLLGFVSRRRKV